MKINPDFIDYCNNRGLDLGLSKAFALWWLGGHHSTILNAIACNFISKEDSEFYRVELCEQEGKLKIPLFSETDRTTEYIEFKAFLRTCGVFDKGHLNAQQDYGIWSKNSTEDEEAFNCAFSKIKSCTPERLALVVANYYETTKPAMALRNFLNSENAIQAYDKYI